MTAPGVGVWARAARARRSGASPTVAGAIVGLLAGAVILGPALAPGYLLHYDLVFVPHLGFGERTLGIDGSIPRAVPNDLLVALLTTVLPGWLVEKGLLLLVFGGVGAGVGALSSSRAAASGAALAATWNPWVGERLGIGHWGYLLGYAALPWVARAASSARAGRPHGRWRLAAWIGVAGLGGSTAWALAVLVAVAVLLLPATSPASGRGRSVLALGGAAALAAGPWLWPTLALAPSATADPLGVELFAARADTPLGVLVSLVTGGGIWNEAVWLVDRRGAIGAAAALLAVILALAGFVRSRTWRGQAAVGGLLGAGLVGLAIALVGAFSGGRAVLAWLGETVPGAGLLRDGQKFMAPWMLLVALATGVTVDLVWRAFGASAQTPGAVLTPGAALTPGAVLAERGALVARAVLAAAPALLGVVALPGLGWGAHGAWQSATYPAAMIEAAERVDAMGGTVAVLPWATYRRFDWNRDRVVLDPWARLGRGRGLSSDELPVSGQRVRGESPAGAEIGEVSRGTGPMDAVLQRHGVTAVLILTDQPGAAAIARRVGGEVAFSGPGLELRTLAPGPVAAARADDQSPWFRLVGLAAGLASVLVSLGFAATRIGFATSIIRLPGMWPKRLPAGKLPPTPPP